MHIALQFASAAFVAGGSGEGFEPEARLAMMSDRTVPEVSGATPAPGNVIEQLRSMRSGNAGAVALRIGR
jgi:hypothetical protein